MTLREILNAHAERKRVMGEVAAVEMAFICKLITGKDVNPADLNPYGERPKARPKSSAAIQRESDAAWRLLDKFFCGA